jgi:hypothetical protein
MVGCGGVGSTTKSLLSLAKIVNRPSNWPCGAPNYLSIKAFRLARAWRKWSRLVHSFAASTTPTQSDTACGSGI